MNFPEGTRVIDSESYEKRLERILEFKDKNHKHPNILAIRYRNEGYNTVIKERYLGANIVTEHGETYYAKRGALQPVIAGQGATHMQLANPGTVTTPAANHDYDNLLTPIAGSLKAIDAGYPKAPDDDTNNADRAAYVITYRVTYTATDFNATNIKNGAVFGTASPTTNTPIVALFTFPAPGSFTKEATDTLQVWANHSVAGA